MSNLFSLKIPVEFKEVSKSTMKVFIIPGNGSGDILNCMWYPWVKKKLNDAGMTKYGRKIQFNIYRVV